MPPPPGRLWQCVGFWGEAGAEVWIWVEDAEVALSALCFGVVGDLGFWLPLGASRQARVCVAPLALLAAM